MNVIERFLNYVSYDTQSDENSSKSPSTSKQKVLGAFLAEELRAIGLVDVSMDKYGYVYGRLPANVPGDFPVLGLMAHMDTSPDCSGAGVAPRIVEYTGGDIVLNEELGIVMSPAQFESLADNVGKHLIVTDGTTLLGADDKAGIAEIFTALETVVSQDLPHGDLRVVITPDEEVGRGTERLDLGRFGADYGYTVDGGTLGEIEYENFNAAAATASFTGVSIHPGYAKGKMKNACLMAQEFAALLPEMETPEHTEGYEGFFHLHAMEGGVESAKLMYLIRDHDGERFAARKECFLSAARQIEARWGAGSIHTEIRDTYYNMREKILPHMYIVERAVAAMESCGVTPRIQPIRGGTDGALVSYMGIPCPNLSTGGENFHGHFEYIPVEDMETMVAVLCRLITDIVK
ncbi:MAG: peptidase T [Oscillospiraceae bacterium]|nr:peptidase T [Oscillospiraceae bacterium]